MVLADGTRAPLKQDQSRVPLYFNHVASGMKHICLVSHSQLNEVTPAPDSLASNCCTVVHPLKRDVIVTAITHLR